MIKQQGMTLIEIIMFIIIISIVTVGSLLAFSTVLTNSNGPSQIMTAAQLAQARMELIVQQRNINGFSSIQDPCSAGSPPACTALAAFASAKGFTVSSSIPAAVGGIRTATVTVTGTEGAMVVMRFMQ